MTNYIDEAYRLVEDEVILEAFNNGNSKRQVPAQVVRFVEEKFLVVNISLGEASTDINLRYVPASNEYVGSSMGIEFFTAGPKKIIK